MDILRIFYWFWVNFIDFFAFAALSQIWYCQKLRTFWVNLFCLKLGWCKENDIFHVWYCSEKTRGQCQADEKVAQLRFLYPAPCILLLCLLYPLNKLGLERYWWYDGMGQPALGLHFVQGAPHSFCGVSTYFSHPFPPEWLLRKYVSIFKLLSTLLLE